MKADIGRMTFDPAKHFTRVVLQQGRVQVEADWNEQVAILLHAVRTLAADVVGPWGGSRGAFRIEAVDGVLRDAAIGGGHYYVDGVRVENDADDARYTAQPYYPVPDDERLTTENAPRDYLLHLDVWERLVTAAEDPDLQDVALGGLDTAARTQVVWQVRATPVRGTELDGVTCQTMPDAWPALQDRIAPPRRGLMRARARITAEEIDRPCAVDPGAAYRLDENALYRVEIHRDGSRGVPSIKWSLDNGSVAMPVESFAGVTLRLATLGRDPRLTLDVGDRVELEWDDSVLQNLAAALLEVTAVDPTDLTVQVASAPPPVPAAQHPRLRRWDQKDSRQNPLAADGTVDITTESGGSRGWIELAHGVQVQFVPEPGTVYRTGDFWLIEARTAIGDVVWPQVEEPGGGSVPAALPPRGVEHHRAPLARVRVAADGTVTVAARYVRELVPSATCPAGP
jgi:hypothetical protein